MQSTCEDPKQRLSRPCSTLNKLDILRLTLYPARVNYRGRPNAKQYCPFVIRYLAINRRKQLKLIKTRYYDRDELNGLSFEKDTAECRW